MKILKEQIEDLKSVDNMAKTSNWAKWKGWTSLISDTPKTNEELNENVLTEDKYVDIEKGTCFKLASKPAVYEIIQCDEQTGEIIFQSYGHPHGNWWRTTYNYLVHLIDIGEFEILDQDQINRQWEYEP